MLNLLFVAGFVKLVGFFDVEDLLLKLGGLEFEKLEALDFGFKVQLQLR